MPIQHRDIPDGEIHETKGVTSATDGQVLTAISSAGQWLFPNYTLTLTIPNLDTTKDYYIVALRAGQLLHIRGVIDKSISTNDAVITASIAGVGITSGILTFPFSGSAAGNVVSVVPSANNTVTSGQAIKFTVTGGATGSATCTISLLFSRTS